MPIKYDYDKEKNIINAYPTGVILLSELSAYFNQLAEDQNVEKEFIEIVNLDGVEEFKFSYSDALEIPNLFAELINKKNQKGTIMIAKKDFQYGMARMISIIVEASLPTRVVRSQEDAEKEIKSLRG